MKFVGRREWDEPQPDLDVWHTWFAWYPVRVGNRDVRWLEKVKRIRVPIALGWGTHWWDYRALEGKVRE